MRVSGADFKGKTKARSCVCALQSHNGLHKVAIAQKANANVVRNAEMGIFMDKKAEAFKLELAEQLQRIAAAEPYKLVISKPAGEAAYHKIVVEEKEACYQAAAYTQKQVFHQNISKEHLVEYLISAVTGQYLQVNAWDGQKEHGLLISKKGKVTYRISGKSANRPKAVTSHNRSKKYLLPEGEVIPPLVDMGIFTKEGKVIHAMYDKYRQINRFLEIVEDGLHDYAGERLNIIDFGCGKSYLTFVLYYYLHEIRGKEVEIVGLDLKEEVIRDCNRAAQKYGYDQLRFEIGEISGYQASFPVDMVVTLHACDTATDYALYHAICWGAKMIFSVPCCQHEINRQIKSDRFSLMTRYGIVKERFSALLTDAVRGNLLEYCGYKTQLLEFVDLAHTPKNILIRAVQTGSPRALGDSAFAKIVPSAAKKKYLAEVAAMMEEYHFEPTLYRLLQESGRITAEKL